MLRPPYRVTYVLNRRERLFSHFAHWFPSLPIVVIVLGGPVFAAFHWSLWFVLLLFPGLYITTNFLVGIVDVVIHPVWHVDIMIMEDGVRFWASFENEVSAIDESDRLFIGMRQASIRKVFNVVWRCSSGEQVFNIPVSAISDEQIEELKRRWHLV